MSKKITKKIIIIIILILLLIILFFVHNSYKRNVKPDSITIVKRIMKNNYDKIEYKNNNYILGYYKDDNKYRYDVFDLNGNREYSFYRNNIVNIKSVNKKYFIEKSDIDYLYNDDDKLVLKSSSINQINDYLIKVDNRIINYKNKEIINNVKKIDSYDNDYYFSINDNYLIDKKGNIILKNYKVVEEIENNLIIKCLILTKDKKYYTFLPSLDRIVGDSFDYYYKDKDKIYIIDGNDEYRLYSTGLRNKLDINNEKLVNNYKIENIISNKYAFVFKDNDFGLYDRNKDKFYKVSDNYNSIKKLNNNYYLIKTNDINIIYNIKEKKYDYTSKDNIDNIIVYKNGYKLLTKNGLYVLYNSNNEIIKQSDKQILLVDSQIKYGNVLKDVYVLNDNKLEKSETFTINNSHYALYKDDQTSTIIGLDNKNKFVSNKYLNYYKNTIIYVKNKKIIFNNLKSKDIKEYELDDYKIVSLPFKKVLLLKNNESIKVINFNGKELSEIKNINIKDIYYNEDLGKVILIFNMNNDNSLKEGSYILK